MKHFAFSAAVFLAAGCNNPSGLSAEVVPAAISAATGSASSAPSGSAGIAAAQVGAAAPDFSLRDLDGNEVRLSAKRGNVVVLEWFNPLCPYVRAAHTSGSLRDAAARHSENGVVWLAINSGAPGKQGHGVEVSRVGARDFHMSHPVLEDPDGRVGRSYGAERTPHMFVIDEHGVLAYSGAIDNSPDGEGKSPEGGTLVRYVDEAIAALKSGTPVLHPRTRPYGCSVKY